MRPSIVFLGAALSVSGCSLPSSAPRSHSGGKPVVVQQPYVRISKNDSNLIELQIAVRKFVAVRGRGPAIWLTGVSHVGQSNYYAALQRRLDEQGLVLFEGIGDHSDSPSRSEVAKPIMRPSDASSSEKGGSSLQSQMASSLGLVFQLEAIDYSSANFRNSDLSIQELRGVMSERPSEPGQAGAAQSFETLLQMMQGDSFLNAIMRMLMSFLGSNPKLQALTKIALMESIAVMDGDPAQLRGLPPELHQLLVVLVQKRNQKVLDDLKTEIKRKKGKGPESIAVFFGAGHMPDLELQLRERLKYKPVEDAWLTAFSVDMRQAAVSPAEVEFIRGLVKREMEQLQSQRAQ